MSIGSSETVCSKWQPAVSSDHSLARARGNSNTIGKRNRDRTVKKLNRIELDLIELNWLLCEL